MNSKQLLVDALAPALAEHLSADEILNLIEVPKDTSHGDLAFPVFQLARVFRKAPQQIAADLVEELDTSNFSNVVAVGPYINVSLKREPVGATVVKEVLEAGDAYGNLNIGEGRNMTIDFSSPNIAKPMSMGHLRSTVIGNAIANIAAKVNYNPIRINHLGDWGTQFGKLIVAYKMWGDDAVIAADPVKELVKLYVDFHEVAEEKPELEEEARAAFKKLEDGDAEMIRLWTWFKDESLKEFNKVYDMLNISFDSFNGEAFYNDKMQPIIDELEAKGITTVNEGATIVDLEELNLPPALIKKSDGATLYVTRDLAAASYRKETYDFAKNIYVVGNEQSVHFKQLKAVLTKLGREWSEDMVHVPFGLITLDGKKLSTRKGKIVLLEEVLKEAVDLALEQITAKNPDLANKEAVAHQVGVGAVIFHDLKTERMNSFDFNLAEIVQFEGETGPYVQYTYARSKSIIRKYGKEISTDLTEAFGLTDDYSWEVVKKLMDYPRVVANAIERFEPSQVAKYAVQLAQLFNKYYGNTRILEDDAHLDARLALVKAMTVVLKNALGLLGIEAPEEM
ncbi:arginine--tRNA ligase [Aerococcaceae bacterium DSM 109653]|uniref:Arginine--tRNA ligase n=1 Tax=Fundicoccus ignavus TaxID=2664442 RepID=A0A844BMQ0_9LACT|nr:arginine--tRNA ligase [Fundicoccus ignavus]MRI82404.1 arginine--tRNA ligase [Fundicoccus ignavus]